MPPARPAEATGTRGFTHISTYKWLQRITNAKEVTQKRARRCPEMTQTAGRDQTDAYSQW